MPGVLSTPQASSQMSENGLSKQKRKKDKSESSRKDKRDRAKHDYRSAANTVSTLIERQLTVPMSSNLHTKAAANRQGYLSPTIEQSASMYLPISPVSQQHPLKGLCAEHLSPLILTYYPPLGGIILSYENVRVGELPAVTTASNVAVTTPLSRAIDEYAATYVWVTADFVIFQLQADMLLDGVINLQNESHIGLVVWNLFNATIDRARIPPDWQWSIGDTLTADGDTNEALDAGHFVDFAGNAIDNTLSFRLCDWRVSNASDTERGHVTLEGTLLDP